MQLTRHARRFGGEGTVVTLRDGCAFTAGHCVAAIDGCPGRLIAGLDGRTWRVARRWSPAGLDLAILREVAPGPACATGSGARAALRGIADDIPHLATRVLLRPGVDVAFYACTPRGFRKRRARVIAVTATTATAEVRSRAGVRAGDSGSPVLVHGVLAGIVTHRTGRHRDGQAASRLVCTRLDTRVMKARLRAVLRPRR